jgi:hypothetical protein
MPIQPDFDPKPPVAIPENPTTVPEHLSAAVTQTTPGQGNVLIANPGNSISLASSDYPNSWRGKNRHTGSTRLAPATRLAYFVTRIRAKKISNYLNI